MSEEEVETYLATYFKLFSCNFLSIHKQYIKYTANAIVKTYTRRSELKYCSKRQEWNSTTCLKELEKMCMLKSHTCIMSTDLSMNIVSKMMKIWPNLKVIHAIEEPYAILSSRLRDGSSPPGVDAQHHSANLCARMFEDFKDTRVLQKKYSGRLLSLSFEAMKDSPFSAVGHIYRFFELFLFTEKVWIWVYSNIQSMIKREIYENLRSNQTGREFQFTKYPIDQMIDAIYLSCNDVYYYIGDIFNFTKDLLSRKISF